MLRYLKAVLWSFLGLREKHAFEADQRKLKPIVLIAVGILVCVVVVALIGVVQIVVSYQQEILESS